jgi:hypothetical protein
LVKSGINAANAIGLDIFVVATDAGFRMYQRAGFQLLDEIIQDDSKYGGTGHWGMHFLEKKAE